MTTAQESSNGHHLPPPCSFPDSQGQIRSKDSTDHSSNAVSPTPQPEPFAASAYHVPPSVFAPTPHAYRRFEVRDLPVIPTPLPNRCQFMFSDGRQCTMARSEIHPCLCVYHSEREEQLFGDPGPGGKVVYGRSFDLPELFSCSRDLTTAAGVNRALGQVFRLLAQRRISRQEAATFANLAHLLLQSIRAAHAEADLARAEFEAIHDEHPGVCDSDSVILSAGESHGHQELSPVNEVRSERRISPEPSRATKSTPLPQPNEGDKLTLPPPGFVMKADRPRDSSSIFCRSTTPVVNEERFVFSGSARGERFTPENQRFAQLRQNQHLQNRETSTHSE